MIFAHASKKSWGVISFRIELLEPSSTEAAWNFCAPVVDYDGLRKEVSAIFEDKVVEVQGLVAKLQKTQRAAEQALDKCASSHVSLLALLAHCWGNRYEKTCAA